MHLGEIRQIPISRRDAHFDRATEEAYRQACFIVGVDQDGYINNVEGATRSGSTLMVEWKSLHVEGGMGGIRYIYTFDCWVDEIEDEDAPSEGFCE